MSASTKQIHMVRSAFYRQFTETMQANGIDAQKYYRKVHLPATEPDQLDSLLPEKPFWRLVNRVAIEEDLPDFGYRVALAYPWHYVESLLPLIAKSKTLIELIESFCNVAPSQSSQVQFRLNSINGQHWFIADGRPLINNDIQMELYRVSCMIRLIQLASGSRWRPQTVRLFISKMNLNNLCPLIAQSNVEFCCQQTAIAIPEIALTLPVSLKILDSEVNINDYNIDAKFIESLRMILEIYISQGSSKLDTIAKAISIPRRTLQRRLNDNDTSFKKLLADTRFKLAKIKLKRKDLSIQDISRELGYSDTAHFIRAFKRWSGMLPGKFRKISCQ